ncbi:MAG: hypothetical protein B7X53_10160 [Hyphomonas sp. 34-62-18]|nr:lasso peptide biosynthesis B2 protein [Hyphomonas sp. 34-62-18]OZB15939.1 MAG: hypothetical protein B7X53_10160 [Hyphomonas sp. 34-62-18]
MGPAIQLSESAHAVKVDGSFVLIDIRHDRYLFLKANQQKWLETILLTPTENRELPSEAKLFADRLCQQNLLSWDVLSRSPPMSTLRHVTCASQLSFGELTSSKVTPFQLLRMFRAVSACWWLERSTDFAGIIAAVSQWKTYCQSSTEDKVRTELAAFATLTPFFFTSHEACRFRSLVLLKYLTLARILPDWVFAVRLAPFAAHCWVEWTGHVLNEDVERTQDYSVILRV